MIKHEIIQCERCSTRIECKANSYTKCQCTAVQLSLNETQYVSENFEGCLCAACLLDLKKEYHHYINSVSDEVDASNL
ncbi:MAG: cysteine-rich CWC family protein [Sphingobacteriaceae bacterium]|nr:cysteine-rich CWC family protein [Sphingobacteriaceae bacterium]